MTSHPAVPVPVAPSGLCLEQFRPYLSVLARIYWGRKYRRRLDTSDIVQQTLLRAHQGWATFRGQDAAELTAWLRRILSSTIANAAREHAAAARDIAREQPDDVGLEASSVRLTGLLADPGESPSGRAMEVEQSVRLAKALSDLPEQQREAVLLRYCSGLGIGEVAAELGRSPAGVASLLRRGLARLREEMHEFHPTGGGHAAD
jgi:RNA polymerase sigma-70 factor, ECF subfamily